MRAAPAPKGALVRQGEKGWMGAQAEARECLQSAVHGHTSVPSERAGGGARVLLGGGVGGVTAPHRAIP